MTCILIYRFPFTPLRTDFGPNYEFRPNSITIVDDLIPASDRAHQIRVRRRPSFKSNDIAFQKAAALCRFQFWVVYITNTSLRRLRHDFPIFTDKLGSINCGRHPAHMSLIWSASVAAYLSPFRSNPCQGKKAEA